MERQPIWMRLDNAAKIYPAARRRQWSSLFRVSASFTDEVKRDLLQTALDDTVKRFPSMAVKLRKGLFWYYLEELSAAPAISDEAAYPMARMSARDLRQCAFRVICYKNRLAVEFFHALTDGTGGMIFLKTLAARYVELRYGVTVPCTHGILNINEPPLKKEMEDSFLKNDGPVSKSRREATAYRIGGDIEPDGYLNLITGIMPAQAVVDLAKSYGVSITVFLTAVMIFSILKLQNKATPKRSRQKPVKVLVPINLRPIFKSGTLRNFALYAIPGVDPRLGEYTFEEVVKQVHHQLGLEVNAKNLAAKIAANVGAERNILLKLMPLFIKNVAMKAVFNLVGERKSSITVSNLGRVELPQELCPFITRFDFIIGEQAICNNACSAITYDGRLHISFLRTVMQSEVELEFFRFLKKAGIDIKIESNRR